VLRQFARETADRDGPVVIVAHLDCPAGDTLAVQAESLREQLAAVAVPSRCHRGPPNCCSWTGPPVESDY
jgi:hypothetical protein